MQTNRPESQKTVLCVDDDAGILAALRRVLRPLGHRVLTALDAFQGLQIAIAERPDMILLDLRMPHVDGYEFIRRLHGAGMDDIPVVMLTASQDLTGGYRSGCAYYMTKPCHSSNVHNIVQYMIGDLSEQERQALELSL